MPAAQVFRRLFNGRFGYAILDSHSVLNIYLYTYEFPLKRTTISHNVARGARLVTYESQPFICHKQNEEKKKKQIKTTKLLEMCVFRFSIYVRSSLDLFIYSFCVTKCCRYGTKLNRRKNKTCFFYAEESLRIPTNAISGSKFFGKKNLKSM